MGWPCRNFANIFIFVKLEWLGYRVVKNCDDTLSRFDTIPERDGQTDGENSLSRVSIAVLTTRDKISVTTTWKILPLDVTLSWLMILLITAWNLPLHVHVHVIPVLPPSNYLDSRVNRDCWHCVPYKHMYCCCRRCHRRRRRRDDETFRMYGQWYGYD